MTTAHFDLHIWERPDGNFGPFTAMASVVAAGTATRDVYDYNVEILCESAVPGTDHPTSAADVDEAAVSWITDWLLSNGLTVDAGDQKVAYGSVLPVRRAA